MSDLLKFSIPGKPEYIQIVRLAIGSAGGKAGYNMDQIDDMQVAVAEACKLITCHKWDGYSQKYDVTMEIFEDKIELIVTDAGQGHGVEKNPVKMCKNCPEEGDLAAFIIESLMDEIEIQRADENRNSRSIRMVKNK